MPDPFPTRRPTALAAAILAAATFGGTTAAQARKPVLTPAQEAAAFMQQKSAEPGVTTLPSGLEYKVIESGDASGQHPKATDSVMVIYTGKLTDGAIFDDSHNQITTLPLGGVIKGWSEGLQLMRPGDVWMFYIPPALAYGTKGGGPIPPDAALQFKVELVAIAGQ
ncbi:MAG: FKBP-type peptidyl-prolyl cis-trans isomerase [Gluconacetobacter diazotrophicus]|nr:FKBP-type peptidyl-prolyl cis-trans isomerase [Gluconacetobacter diazotrophicus]